MPIYRGAVYSKDIQFSYRANDQPIDITPWQFSCSLRALGGNEEELMALTTSGGQFLLLDGPKGIVRLLLNEAQTAALAPNQVQGAVYRIDTATRRLFHFTEIVRDGELVND
jgi:hypothetical protein